MIYMSKKSKAKKTEYKSWIKHTESGVNYSSHLLLVVIVSSFIAIGFWANQAELDEVTRGEGRIIPSSQVQTIQNLEGGIVSEILVTEGQSVEVGQTLIKLDHTQFSSILQESRAEELYLLARVERLRAEAESTLFTPPPTVLKERPLFIKNEKKLLESRKLVLTTALNILHKRVEQHRYELDELYTSIDGLTDRLQLGNKELAIATPLARKGIMPEIELIRLQRDIAEIKGELKLNRASIPRLKSEIEETEQQIKREEVEFKTRALDEINRSRSALIQLQERIPTLSDRVKRTEILSPVNGVVKQLNIQTIGGVIQPGIDIIEIVPLDEKLLVEAQIRPADIAFLHPGLKANVKLTAYDSTIYGGISATLEHISADTILDSSGEHFYLIRLRTEDNFINSEGTSLPIIPGMVATVEILTGQKTIMDYLLKPLLKTQQNALRER